MPSDDREDDSGTHPRIGWRDPMRGSREACWRWWPIRVHDGIIWCSCGICGSQGRIMSRGSWYYCPKCLGITSYMMMASVWIYKVVNVS